MQTNLIALTKTLTTVFRRVDEADEAVFEFGVEDGSVMRVSVDEYVDAIERVRVIEMEPIRRSLQMQNELLHLLPGHRVLYFIEAALAVFCPNSFLHEEHILTRIYPILAKYIQFLKQYIREFCVGDSDDYGVRTAGSLGSAGSHGPIGSGGSAGSNGSLGSVASASAQAEPRTAACTTSSSSSVISEAVRRQRTEWLLNVLVGRQNELSQFGDTEKMCVFRFAAAQAFTPLVHEMAGAFLD